VDALLRWLSRSGVRHGMAGGHLAWWALAGIAFALYRARRHEVEAISLRIRPGDRFVLTASDPTAPPRHPGT